MDRFESIFNFMHFNKNDHVGTYQGHLSFWKSIQSCPTSTQSFSLYLPGQNIAIKWITNTMERKNFFHSIFP